MQPGPPGGSFYGSYKSPKSNYFMKAANVQSPGGETQLTRESHQRLQAAERATLPSSPGHAGKGKLTLQERGKSLTSGLDRPFGAGDRSAGIDSRTINPPQQKQVPAQRRAAKAGRGNHSLNTSAQFAGIPPSVHLPQNADRKSRHGDRKSRIPIPEKQNYLSPKQYM